MDDTWSLSRRETLRQHRVNILPRLTHAIQRIDSQPYSIAWAPFPTCGSWDKHRPPRPRQYPRLAISGFPLSPSPEHKRSNGALVAFCPLVLSTKIDTIPAALLTDLGFPAQQPASGIPPKSSFSSRLVSTLPVTHLPRTQRPASPLCSECCYISGYSSTVYTKICRLW